MEDNEMKKNWRKYVSTGVVLSATALLLAACGSSSSSSSDSSKTEDSSSAKVSGDIKLWVDTEQVDMFKPIVADFEKEYPDVNLLMQKKMFQKTLLLLPMFL